MKPYFYQRTTFVVLLLSLFSLTSFSQGYLKTDGKRIINQNGQEVILRGIGLGGWMLQEGYMLRVGNIGNQQHVIKGKIQELIGSQKTQEFYDAWLSNHTRKIDIDSLAAWGFNSVRLPMHYNLYTLPVDVEPIKGQQTWLAKGFAMTDSLLKWCKANKMYLILDLHAAPGGQGNDVNISDRDGSKPSLWQSEENQQKMIALWKKLAERYANEPWIGAYDIINEPNWGFEKAEDKNGCAETKNEPLKKLMVEITKTIREVDKKHIIIIEGNCWGNNYNGIFPTWDSNMVVSFHKYWNYNDKASIQKMLDIREKNNVPIWLGETGENSNVWFTEAIQLAENNQIGWCWWPLKKLGFNNPLEIKMNPEYQKVIDFWNGKGAKPTEAEANKAFTQLADNAKLENCIYHKDVIDAMFRQAHSNNSKPFNKNSIQAKTTIYAVNFDLGKSGIAYFDKDTADFHISTGKNTAGNRGRMYRNDGVDIEVCKDTVTNGYNVAHIESGEWLQYSLNVEKMGNYTLNIRIASDNADGKVSIISANTELAKNIVIPNTGGLQHWQTLTINNIHLKQGKNVIKVQMDNGGFNLNYLQFERNQGK